MITLFTGAPGAGKTAAMVDILRQEMGDRPIYVHYDQASKRRSEQVVLHESLQIPHEICHADTWFKDVPDGSIIVIDECQEVWRARAAGSKVPEAIQALETHRHAGVDFFITTQAPRLIDPNVRGLVGRHVHIRDVGWYGRWWYEWPECNEGLAWKTCQNKRRYKLPKKVFELYRSANVHTQAPRGVPPMLYVAAFLLLALVLLGWRIYASLSAEPSEVPAAEPEKASLKADATRPVGLLSVNYSLTGPIDDRVAWVPRISSRPESAPAYDHLRKVEVMAEVVGGWCKGNECRCITQQGTQSGLSSQECKAWMANPPFRAYAARPEMLVSGHDDDPRQALLQQSAGEPKQPDTEGAKTF